MTTAAGTKPTSLHMPQMELLDFARRLHRGGGQQWESMLLREDLESFDRTLATLEQT